jgi:alpha-tubulin suppressor-like RCC1 family protein
MKLTPISLVLSVFAFRLAIAEQQPVIDIVSGGNHNCAIFADSSVKCWGSNQNGQLGLGHTATYGNAPDQMGQELPSLRLGTGVKVWTLAAGANHTCALFVDGRIKCWGENQDGQLGLGDTRSRGDTPGSMGDRLPFIDLGEGRTAVQIATGARHTCALLDNGALKCWGYNGHGQLGQGNAFNYGSVSDTMGDVLDPVKLGKGMKVIQVTAGALHTCALLDNRTTKCWGYAQYGTLGQGNQNQTGDSPVEMGDRLPPIDLGTNGSRVAELVAGGLHQCARFESGAVKCWGLQWQRTAGSRGHSKSGWQRKSNGRQVAGDRFRRYSDFTHVRRVEQFLLRRFY